MGLDERKLVVRKGGDWATWVVLEYWFHGVGNAQRPLTVFCNDYKSSVQNKERARELLEHRIVEVQNNPVEILGAINREIREVRTQHNQLPGSATLQLTPAQLRAVACYYGLNVPVDVQDARLYGLPVEIVTEPQDSYLTYSDDR